MSHNRHYDYSSVKGVSKEEFLATAVKFDETNGTLTPPGDVEKIEDMLMLRRGILANDQMWVNRQQCPNCGRICTFYDIVKTAVDQSRHSVSLMAHTLVGNKYVINPPRMANCAQCGHEFAVECTYNPPQYGCCWDFK